MGGFRSRYLSNGGREPVSRDEYGNTAKGVMSEKDIIARDIGQITPGSTAKASPYDGLGIPDTLAAIPETGGIPSEQVDISDEYASRHRAERLGKQNITDVYSKGEIGTTQYRNEDPGIDRNKPTGWLERTADSIDDGYDDVMAYIFGKPTYKNKKEEEEAARADMNLQVNEDGNTMYSRQATMNDKSIDSLRSNLMNAKEDPEADQLIYYARIDNLDGTSSYKIGLAGVDTFSRTAEEDRGKDITYLWTKRTKDAAKYEAMFHGNRSMLKTRRNDIGTDVENYGAGKSEIYNADFMQLDGSASADKVRTLNMSSAAKLDELGVHVADRYDSRGMELAYKELDKKKSLYGENSVEYEEMAQLVANMEHKGKKTRALIRAPGDLASAVGSGIQQVAAGLGDLALDATATVVNAGQGEWLDNVKSAESADETWGYKGRHEVEALGRQAVRQWKKGDYVGALFKGIKAAPDTIAQSAPDMALMLYSGGLTGAVTTAAKAGRVAQKAAALKIAEEGLKASGQAYTKANLKAALPIAMMDTKAIDAGVKATEKFSKRGMLKKAYDPATNHGLMAFSAKEVNNQIDERIANGDTDVNLAQVAGMFALEYSLAGIDRWALGKELNVKPIKAMMKAIPEGGMVGVAKKAAAITSQLVKNGSIEAAQEFTQTWGETINGALGTEKYGDDPFSEHFMDAATKGAILGFGAGGVMHGGVMAAKGVKERKRKTEVNNSTDLFGNVGSNTELNTLFGERELNNTESLLQATGKQSQSADETYSTFQDNVKNSTHETEVDAIEDLVTNAETLMYSSGERDATGRVLMTLLERAVDSGTITKDQAKGYADRIKEGHEAVQTLAKDLVENPTDSKKVELANKLNNMNTKNFSVVLSELSNVFTKEGDTRQERLVLLDELIATAEEGSASQKVYESIKTNLIAKGEQEIATDSNTQESEDAVEDAFGTGGSSKAAQDAFGGKSRDTKTKKILDSLPDIYSKVLYLAKTQSENGDTASIVSAANEYFTSILDSGNGVTSSSVSGKALSKTLFSRELSSEAELVIATKMEEFGALTVEQREAFLTAQMLINTGFAKSRNVQNKMNDPSVDMESIANTARGIFNDTKGNHSKGKPSLQSHLNTIMRVISGTTDAISLKSKLDSIDKSLEIFLETKNSKTGLSKAKEGEEPTGTLTAELQELSDIEKSHIEAFKALLPTLLGMSTKEATEIIEDTVEDTTQTGKKKKKKNKKKADTNSIKARDERLFANIFKQVDELLVDDTIGSKDSKSRKALIRRLLRAMVHPEVFVGKLKDEDQQEVLEELLPDRISVNEAGTAYVYKYLNDKGREVATEMTKFVILAFKSAGKATMLMSNKISESLTNILPTEGTDTKDVVALSEMIEEIQKSIGTIVFDEKTIEKYLNSNPYLYTALDKNGHLHKDIQASVIKGALEAIRNYSIQLAVNPQESIKNEDLNNLGVSRSEFISYMSKAIQDQLDLVLTAETMQKNRTTLEGVVEEYDYAITNPLKGYIAESIALVAVESLISDSVMLDKHSSAKGNVTYIYFRQNADQNGIDMHVREKDIALKHLYKDLVEQEIIGKVEQEGLVPVSDKISYSQKRIKKSNDKPNEHSAEQIEQMESISWYPTEMLKAITKQSVFELLNLFNMNIKSVNPSRLLTHTDINIKEYYKAVIGKEPTPSMDISDMASKLQDAYNNHMSEIKNMTREQKASYEGNVGEVVQIIKTIQAFRDLNSPVVHYAASVGANGRLYMQGLGLLEPQSDKFFRYMMTTETTTSSVVHLADTTSNLALHEFKENIVSALPSKFFSKKYNKKADYRNDKANIEAFADIVIPDNVAKLVDALLDGTISPKDMKVLGGFIDIKDSSIINAIHAYGEYKRAHSNKTGFFVHSNTIGVDGKASAAAFLSAMEGNIEDTWELLLSTGQLTTTAKQKLIGKNPKLEQEITDAETVADLLELGIEIKDGYELATLNLYKESPEIVRAIGLLLGNELVKVTKDENGEEVVELTVAGRNFSKDPLMTYLYGRQERAITTGTATVLIEQIQTRIHNYLNVSNKADTTMVEDLEEALDVLSTMAVYNENHVRGVQTKGLNPKDIKSFIAEIDAGSKHDAKEIENFLKYKATALIEGIVTAKMYDVLEETNAPMLKNRQLLNHTANMSVIFGKVVQRMFANLNINNGINQIKDIQTKLMDSIREDYLFGIGDSTYNQVLHISDTTVNEEASGNQRLIVPNTKEGGSKTVSVSKPSYELDTNPGAAAVSSIHNIDKAVVALLVKYGYLQVFDNVVVTSGDRSAVAGMANLGFIAEAYFPTENLYKKARLHMIKLLKEFEHMSNNDAVEKEFMSAFAVTLNNLKEDREDKTMYILFNSLLNSKKVTSNSSTFRDMMKSLVKKLEESETAFETNREEKISKLDGSVTQYSSSGPVLISGNRITGIKLANGAIHPANIDLLGKDPRKQILKLVEEVAKEFGLEKTVKEKEFKSKDTKTKVSKAVKPSMFNEDTTAAHKGIFTRDLFSKIGTRKHTSESAYIKAVIEEIYRSDELTTEGKQELVGEITGKTVEATEALFMNDQVEDINNILQEAVERLDQEERVEKIREEEVKGKQYKTRNPGALTETELETVLDKRGKYWELDGTIPKKVIARIKELVRSKTPYVVFDLENTFKMLDQHDTILQFGGMRFTEGKPDSELSTLYFKPTFYEEFMEGMKSKKANAKYAEAFESEEFSKPLDASTSNTKTEEDLSKFLYETLSELTNNGKYPIVAYNGYNSDLPIMQQLATRTNNVKLQALLAKIEVIDPYTAAYVLNTSRGTGTHTLEAMVETMLPEENMEEFGKAHTAEADVNMLNALLEAIADTKEETKKETAKEKPKPESSGLGGMDLFSIVEEAMEEEGKGNSSEDANKIEDGIEESINAIKAETVETIFESMVVRDELQEGEESFIRGVFDAIVKPFYQQGNETLLFEVKRDDVLETDDKTLGTYDLRYESDLPELIKIMHKTGDGKTKQSSSEVFVHENIHIIIDKIFGNPILKNRFSYEYSLLESIYDDAKKQATNTWFRDESMDRYDYVFREGSKEKRMKEFYAHMLSDHVLAKHVSDNVTNPILKEASSIDTSNGIISFVESVFMKVLNYLIHAGDHRKNLKADALLLSMALDMNGLENMYKSKMYNNFRRMLDNIDVMMYSFKYGTREIANHVTVLDKVKLIANLDLNPEMAHKVLINDYNSDVGGFLQDILPSTEYMNKYYELSQRAATYISKARETKIRDVSTFILGVVKGVPAITVRNDEALHHFVLKYDLQSLFRLPTSDNVRDTDIRALGVLQQLDNTDEAIRILSERINASPALIESIKKAGEHLYNRTNNKASVSDINLRTSNASVLAESHDASYYTEEIDALITLFAIGRDENLQTFLDEVGKEGKYFDSFYKTLDISEDVEDRFAKIKEVNRKIALKGSTTKVTNDTTRLIPVIMTEENIATARKLGNELVDSVTLDGIDVKVGIYKIEESVLSNRNGGLIGLIDLEMEGSKTLMQLLTEAGASKNTANRMMKKLHLGTNIKSRTYFAPVKSGKGEVRDFVFVVPPHLENQYLDIDERASTSLAHKRGSLEEFYASKKENSNWLTVATEDAEANLLDSPSDFVWVGIDSRSKELQLHYKTLPNYLKQKIKKSPILSNNGENGLWVRKEALTMSMGTEGGSVVDLLESYNITDKTVRDIVRRVENGLTKLAKLFKLDVVMKNFVTIAGNITSNVLLEMLKGRQNYIEVLQVFFRNMRELHKINVIQRDISETRIRQRGTTDPDEVDAIEDKLDRLRAKAKKSSVWYMVEEGFHDNFIDDLNVKESLYMSDTDKKIYQYAERFPKMKKAFDIAYVNKGTTLNKWFTNAFILADVAAQITSDQLDKKYIEQDIKNEFKAYFGSLKKQGLATEEIRNIRYKAFRRARLATYELNRKRMLGELTIMYSAATGGKVATYLDKTMINPFYKYKLRIKRVLLRRFKEKPVVSSLAGLLQTAADGVWFDLESAQESAFKIFSAASFSIVDNTAEGISPALYDLMMGYDRN